MAKKKESMKNVAVKEAVDKVGVRDPIQSTYAEGDIPLNTSVYTAAEVDALVATRASIEDVTLTERGPNHDGFSEWTVVPPTYQGSRLTPHWNSNPGEHYWELRNELGEVVVTPVTEVGEDALELNWDDGEPLVFSATREALPGYVLGRQTNKPIPKLSDIPAVVSPSTDAADEGKAADAKATADVLAGKLSKAEAEAGFTEWEFAPSIPDNTRMVWSATLDGTMAGWQLESIDPNIEPLIAGSAYLGNKDSTNITWEASDYAFVGGEQTYRFTATHVRLPTMADLELKQDTISDLDTIRAGALSGAAAEETLQFKEWFPGGEVKSIEDCTVDLKYDWDNADETNHTVKVLAFASDGVTPSNGNAVGNIVIPPYVEREGVRYMVTAIGDYGDQGPPIGATITSLKAPTTVTQIGYGAFSYCSKLTSVSFPAVTTIGDSVFSSCSSLTFISLPVASIITQEAFNDCFSLASVSLPVTMSIGFQAFRNSTLLTFVDFGPTARQSIPTLGTDAFSDLSQSGHTCKIIVPDANYDAWTTNMDWATLTSMGYEFLRHSEWDCAHRYETQLTPVYSDTPTFSEWVLHGNTGGYDEIFGPTDMSDGWVYSRGPYDSQLLATEEEALYAQYLIFDDNVTATRTRTDIVGYTLGDQADKPLALSGDYALKGEVPFVKSIGTDSAKQIQTQTDPVVNGSENKATSQGSIAVGASNIAGLKGYRYTNTGSVTNSLTFEVVPEGWAIGDVVSVVNDSKYPDCATIASISETTVTFTENLPFDSIVDESDWDSKIAYISVKPFVGNIDLGYGAYAEGVGSKALNAAAHAEGRETKAFGQYSHTEGRETKAQYCAHAEGRNTEATGNYSHVEGVNTKANFKCSHTEGYLSKSLSDYSHAEGYNTNAGDGTKEGGWCSHAEGNSTVASGQQAHAEGLNTVASGVDSHAEGTLTIASGKASHAEGSGVSTNILEAKGQFSHAEGACTHANGGASHAEGYNTVANGANSHAEGGATITQNWQEHAEGRFNLSHKQDTSWGQPGNTLHSVGHGTSESDRKNALEIMQNGKVFITGVGGYDGTNPTESGVKDAATVINEGGSGSMLTPIYTDTSTFSEWTFSDVSDGITDIQQPVFMPFLGGEPTWEVSFGYDGGTKIAELHSNEDATNLAFVYNDEGLDLHLTATRTRTDILGYQLGSQSDKQLAPASALSTKADLVNGKVPLSQLPSYDDHTHSTLVSPDSNVTVTATNDGIMTISASGTSKTVATVDQIPTGYSIEHIPDEATQYALQSKAITMVYVANITSNSLQLVLPDIYENTILTFELWLTVPSGATGSVSYLHNGASISPDVIGSMSLSTGCKNKLVLRLINDSGTYSLEENVYFQKGL